MSGTSSAARAWAAYARAKDKEAAAGARRAPADEKGRLRARRRELGEEARRLWYKAQGGA